MGLGADRASNRAGDLDGIASACVEWRFGCRKRSRNRRRINYSDPGTSDVTYACDANSNRTSVGDA
jgi:YD repeat-containing protein